MKRDIYIILHNIRSTYNVGAIFRTADARGVKKMFLTGYTPTPIDRFGRVRKDIHKTALGAEKSVEWGYVKNPQTVVKQLKKEGVVIASIEQDNRSIKYTKLPKNKNICCIFGNEVRGVSKSLRDSSDYIAEIPMYGEKESLNVSVSVGVVLFGL